MEVIFTPGMHMEKMLHKLRHKRNVLFKTFLINLALIIIVWLLSMTPFYSWVMGWSDAQMNVYIYSMIGLWKILNVTFFLCPAIANAWEIHTCKKMI